MTSRNGKQRRNAHCAVGTRQEHCVRYLAPRQWEPFSVVTGSLCIIPNSHNIYIKNTFKSLNTFRHMSQEFVYCGLYCNKQGQHRSCQPCHYNDVVPTTLTCPPTHLLPALCRPALSPPLCLFALSPATVWSIVFCFVLFFYLIRDIQ